MCTATVSGTFNPELIHFSSQESCSPCQDACPRRDEMADLYKYLKSPMKGTEKPFDLSRINLVRKKPFSFHNKNLKLLEIYDPMEGIIRKA